MSSTSSSDQQPLAAEMVVNVGPSGTDYRGDVAETESIVPAQHVEFGGDGFNPIPRTGGLAGRCFSQIPLSGSQAALLPVRRGSRLCNSLGNFVSFEWRTHGRTRSLNDTRTNLDLHGRSHAMSFLASQWDAPSSMRMPAQLGQSATVTRRAQYPDPTERLALIMGTSACIMATARQACFVPGLWGLLRVLDMNEQCKREM